MTTSADSRGISLVELVVTLAISSILLIGVVEVSSLQQKSTQNLVILNDWNEFLNDLTAKINHPPTCEKIFGSAAFKYNPSAPQSLTRLGAPVTELSLNSFPLAKVGDQRQNFTLTQMKFAPLAGDITGVTQQYGTGSAQVYSVGIFIEARKKSSGLFGGVFGLGGSTLKTKQPIPVSLLVDRSGGVLGCASARAVENSLSSSGSVTFSCTVENDNSGRTVVSCPTGKIVAGGGGSCGSESMVSSEITGTAEGWKVECINSSGISHTPSGVFAVCCEMN